MEAHHHNIAVPCRCGGQAKIFGPSGYAPTSHWGIYCSKDNCDIRYNIRNLPIFNNLKRLAIQLDDNAFLEVSWLQLRHVSLALSYEWK